MNGMVLDVVDETLAYAEPDISMDMVADFEATMMFAQAAARAANPDVTSMGYFGDLVKRLSDLGWQITDQGQGQQTYEPPRGERGRHTLAGLVEQFAQGYLTMDQMPGLDSVFVALQRHAAQAPQAAETAALLRFWWSKLVHAPGRVALAVGSLHAAGQLTARRVFLDFRFEVGSGSLPAFRSWRQLFTPLRFDTLTASRRYLSMSLNMDRWQARRAAVLERIRGREAAHIRRLRLDECATGSCAPG